MSKSPKITSAQVQPRRPAVRMQWGNLAFFHWPVPVESLRARIPEALSVDTFDGTAWLALVPFTMPVIRPGWLPPVPTAHRFHECNVRTYVTDREGVPGVWFFSLDAASRLAVFGARWLWHLNYVHARIDLEREGAVTRYRLARVGDPGVTMRCSWEALGELPTSRAGSLEHFLTERYAMFAEDRRGRLFRGRIWHAPWTLQEARLHELEGNLLPRSAGLDPALVAGPPLCHHAEHLDVVGGALRRVR